MSDKPALKKAILTIQSLKKRLEQQTHTQIEPVAITGMSCRLPESNDLDTFWQNLKEGKNCIKPMPESRWRLLEGTEEPANRQSELPYYGGYLNNIDQFDAYFFGISPREALRMDPQQRLMLEVSFEAFQDAGLTVEALSGSKTGVFSSLYASQYNHLQSTGSDMDALFIPTGSAISIAANRLSYLFNLQGPSLVLDTACSSSLMGIQLACLNIQAGFCEQALVSGANINLLPSIHAVLAKATMLSPTGQCHTFDEAADGYVQGEGVGAIMLKPLSQALKHNDRIYAVIAGSAVNQDGKTNGLTAPNGLQQEALLRKAYQSAGIAPEDLSYIECHGTGTFLGDPIEIQALGDVVGKNRSEDTPCYISSVKTNVGHLEPAAGMMSIIKTALALKNQVIPPHLNFTKPNHHIAFDKYHLKVPTQPVKLPLYGKAAYAGISGFGFGGANAHIVMKNHVVEQPEPTEQSVQAELFTLSAKSPGALKAYIACWHAFLEHRPNLNLSQICYTLHTRHNHFNYRLAILVDTIEALKGRLNELHANKANGEQGQTIWISDDASLKNKKEKISRFDKLDLQMLAHKYVNQADIDWQQFESGRTYANLSLPTYPWQHKRYWPEFKTSTHQTWADSSYPHKGHALPSPLAEKQFEFVFNHKNMPEIADSFYVLHAGYYLEMLVFALHNLSGQSLKIKHIHFKSPLLVQEEKQGLVHLILNQHESDLSFRFFSKDEQDKWVLHAEGEALIQSHPMTSFEPIESIIDRCSEKGSSEAFYQRITNMGMPAGNSIRWTQTFCSSDHEILCDLRPATEKDRGEFFSLQTHPGIIDACIQTLFLVLPETIDKPYVASVMENLQWYGQPDKHMKIYARLIAIENEGQSFLGEWYLINEHNQLVASCTKLRMSQLGNNLQIEQIMSSQEAFRLDWNQPHDACKKELIHFLSKQTASIFSMPVEDIQTHQSLHDLGMDSIMALAMMRVIEQGLSVTLSIPDMMKGPSIDTLAEQILKDKKPSAQTMTTSARENAQTPWIACRKPQENPQTRLFCFPFGGGGASIYREWQNELPAHIEVCPIQLPGREGRMDEQPIHHLDVLIEQLAANLMPYFDRPFAFFGHSFGSLIAFELARHLRRHQMKQPIHLFASAYPSPEMPSRSLDNLSQKLKSLDLDLFSLDQNCIQTLSDEQLHTLTHVFQDNGIVDYNDERMNKSIVEVLLPIFIGDMNIVKNYVYYQENALELNGTVFLGKQDAWVQPADLDGWSNHIEGQCEFVPFEAGHLFIRDTSILEHVIETIMHTLEQKPVLND